MLKRSQIADLTRDESFFWATGIEDTFIADPSPKTGRTLDEYALTRHYENWETDLHLVSELGVGAIRYGVPWYQANPAPGQFHWAFADKVFERLERHGVSPIVDLVHYGTPSWLDNGFLNPDYPQRIAEYAFQMASRYKGRIHWYTPLNEPRITAWYCGKIGWWPPYRKGWRGFCAIMAGVCRGIAETSRALRAADPEIVLAHVDATDIYEVAEPRAPAIRPTSLIEPNLQAEADLRQSIVFLALDLIAGKVDQGHPRRPWLLERGVSARELEWFLQTPTEIDVLGINMYPMFSLKKLARTPRGLRIRMEYAPAEVLERLCSMYWQRYRTPIFISETATLGSIESRANWLDSSVSVVKNLREKNMPIVGYTWWPMFSLVSWGYRQQGLDLDRYLLRMGLWDLDPAEDLARVRTPLVDRFREIAAKDRSRP